MFKLNTVDPTTLSTKLNLYKMRSLLSKALADCRNASSSLAPDGIESSQKSGVPNLGLVYIGSL